MRSYSILFLLVASLFTFSCTKIDYTSLGSNLIPVVDNVNTFDTTLDVITNNFIQNDDSTKLYYNDQLAVGSINDPLFGHSDATLYFEVKPPNFSAYSTARNVLDSSITTPEIPRNYDSTVLCLKFTGGFGDSIQPVTFQVYAIKASPIPDTLRRDSAYNIKRSFSTENSLGILGSRTISLNSLRNDSVSIYRSTTLSYKTKGELRIPLNSNFDWQGLLKDTTTLSSDSLYRLKFAGFAIKVIPATGVGTMVYFNISDSATKLQFFYKRKNNGVDTTYTNFYFNPNNSGYANNVNWDKGQNGNGVNALKNHLAVSPQGDSLIFVKTNPGTQVQIRIPGLQNVSNRIIHRAELVTYQVPDNSPTEGLLVMPPSLYLERYDTTGTNSKFLNIPTDLSPNEAYGTCFPLTSGINFSYFGGYPQKEMVNGVPMNAFKFNISRYVQQIVTNHLANSPLRLTSNLYAQYAGCTAETPFRITSNPINYGSVRLGGGAARGPNLFPYRMRLRIIYSKL